MGDIRASSITKRIGGEMSIDPYDDIDNPENMSEEAERDMAENWGKE